MKKRLALMAAGIAMASFGATAAPVERVPDVASKLGPVAPVVTAELKSLQKVAVAARQGKLQKPVVLLDKPLFHVAAPNLQAIKANLAALR